jgi:hypothetical protein
MITVVNEYSFLFRRFDTFILSSNNPAFKKYNPEMEKVPPISAYR